MLEQPQPIEQETVFSGKIIETRVDTLLMADGRRITREVVLHPGAVAIVPIDDDGNVLLVSQYRHAAGKSLLEIPAGTLEAGESPDDTAQRELQEEIGFASMNLRALGGVYTAPGFCNEFMYLYIARDLVRSRLPADEDEDIEVHQIPISNIDKLIRLGEIQDAKTIAGLLMARYLFD